MLNTALAETRISLSQSKIPYILTLVKENRLRRAYLVLYWQRVREIMVLYWAVENSGCAPITRARMFKKGKGLWCVLGFRKVFTWQMIYHSVGNNHSMSI